MIDAQRRAAARVERRRARPGMESMEARIALSIAPAPSDERLAPTTPLNHDLQNPAGPPLVGPPVRLDVAALHEFGHALGLDHSGDPASIMYPDYNGNYNVNALAADPAASALQTLYANIDASPWNDRTDLVPGDGKVEITYSFAPDGTRLDNGGTSTLFARLDAIYGSPAAWQSIFTADLQRWSDASGGKIQFVQVADGGEPFNALGPQGDIRIAADNFDGPAGVLAHAYYPPPNGATAAGDVILDAAENWTGIVAAPATPSAAVIAAPAPTPTPTPTPSPTPAATFDDLVFSTAVSNGRGGIVFILVIVPDPVPTPSFPASHGAITPAVTASSNRVAAGSSQTFVAAPPSWITRGDQLDARPSPAPGQPDIEGGVPFGRETDPGAPMPADPPAAPTDDPFLRALDELYAPADEPDAPAVPEAPAPTPIGPAEPPTPGAEADPLLAATVVGIGAFLAGRAHAAEPRRRWPSLGG